MVAYSFKSRFVAPIEARTKRQTIRATGSKRHARAGDKVQIYTGDRYHPRKVGEATCAMAERISLLFEKTSPAGRKLHAHVIIGDGDATTVVRTGELDAFARRDGFDSWADLAAFWAETHGAVKEWTGILITWGDTFVPSTPPAGVDHD